MAFAADNKGIFYIACDTDLSAKFLSHIFGSELLSNICVAPSSASSLGQVFQVFNMGLIVFAGGFISYAAVSSAIGKASDGGQAAGKSNPWVPLRLATGTSLLIPLKSGYSFIQLIVMWSVMQGIGLANSIWSKQLEELGTPQTLEPQKSIQTTYNYIFDGLDNINEQSLSLGNDTLKVTNMFAVGMCLAVLEKANQAAQNMSPNIPSVNYSVSNICYNADGARYSDDYMCAGGNIINKNACGVFKFNVDKDNLTAEQMLALTQLKFVIQNEILSAKKKSREILDGIIQTDKEAIAKTENCKDINSVCSTLKQMYNELDKVLLKLVKVPVTETYTQPQEEDWTKPAKSLGWITAGQYYYKFSSQSKDEVAKYKYSETAAYLPKIISGFNIPGLDKSSANALSNSYSKKVFAVGTPEETLSYLYGKLKYVVEGNKVENSFRNTDYGFSENIVSNTTNNFKANPIEKGALLLKNKIYDSLLKPATNVDALVDGTVFSIKSAIDFLTPGSDIRLSAPLDNLIVLLTLSAGELTGLDLRMERWVIKRQDQSNIHSKNNFGQCWSEQNNTENFNTGCILKNSGIIGYLYSYYKKAETDSSGNITAVATIDPLTNLRNIGVRIMHFSVDYWLNTLSAVYHITKDIMIRYSLAKIGVALVSGFTSVIPILGSVLSAMASILVSIIDVLYSIDTYNLSLFLPLGLAISSVIFLMGVMLGIYLPFLPFMIFTFTAIGWIIAVIEAMIAAPLVALGVTHPQGHDLLGKAEQSVILLLGIFIRPSAIILGFIAAIYLLKEALLLVNTGFLTLIPNTLLTSDFTNVNAFISNNIMIFGVLMVYVYIIMAIVNQVFSVIYHVPERILRWIGAAPDNSGISQMVGEVKQGAQAGGQTLAQGGQQMASQKADMKLASSDDVEESAEKVAKTMNKKDQTAEGETK